MTLYFTNEEQQARRDELYNIIKVSGEGVAERRDLDAWGKLDAEYLVSVGRLIKRCVRTKNTRRITYFTVTA